MEEGQAGHEIRGKVPDKQSAPPATDAHLAFDADESMEVDSESEAHDDIEHDIARFRIERANAARTLYHYPRADNDTINSTRSLYDTDVEYHEIHGRRYCGEYYMPNDEDEQTRMQMLHSVYLYLLGNRLTTAPLDNPTKILDIGTGCGDWAMAIGDEYPDADVIGTDIAKIQPTSAPINVYFEIDDAEEEGGWTYGEDIFDLVHFRTMMGAFTDWNHIYKEVYRALKPGGWIEVTDFDDHKTMVQFFPTHSHQVKPWLDAIAEGSRRSGRPRGVAHLKHEGLTDLGFVDVSTETYNIPLGIWPEDPETKKIGKLFMIAQMCGIEALCLRVLTEQMGWDPKEVRKVCDMVSNDLRIVALDADRARGLGFTVKVLKGRKPTLDEQDRRRDRDAESVSTMRNSGSGERAQNDGSEQSEPVNGV